VVFAVVSVLVTMASMLVIVSMEAVVMADIGCGHQYGLNGYGSHKC